MSKYFETTFNVGPTQISDEVRENIRAAVESRVLEISHRSAEFSTVSEKTIKQIRQYFEVPDDYTIFYSTSASDCWPVMIQNLVKETSFHFAVGNFSGQFAKASAAQGRTAVVDEVEWGEQSDFRRSAVPDDAELISVCYNETSTGVMCSNDDISYLRQTYPDKMIAIDLTSIAGVQSFNIADADVWYFSGQKGLGLPSGFGVMIVSPAAMARSAKLKAEGHPTGFWSFDSMNKKMDGKFQTMQTPNTLGIYLLGEELERWNTEGGVATKEKAARARAQKIYDYFESYPGTKAFVEDAASRSTASLVFYADEELTPQFHKAFKARNMVLGGGYGKTKPYCFRVANYPALTDADFDKFFEVFESLRTQAEAVAA